MEFKFNVNDIFKQPIVEINNNLIPPGFSGDRRALWDTLGKVSEVVNTMGEASAVAQGLSKPITTAERLRNSEHKLYFLIDQAANNGKGAVTGMLKTGNKGLYVFDRDGQHYQVTPPCILDFYIHESRQRTGLGKHLFEHMLQKEEIEPVKMAIDRPSDKLLGFLNKHYLLNSPVKQMNNYVVFDGFFPKSAEPSHVTESKPSGNLGRKESANGLQKFTSPQGRYGAPRPPCSMGQIIHNQTTNNKNQEPTGDVQDDVEKPHVSSKLERPQSLSIQKSEEEIGDIALNDKDCKNLEDNVELTDIQNNLKAVKINEDAIAENLPSSEADNAASTKTPSHLTNQGYFDIKFYHNKLW
ncbi:alpha-tubulin N-acetyltransferase isoform X2 [Anoplophora glabripennis]|uniref:alpha-tubulin N-acetyltransferase isoform X2 n=1 Tax=Anoplophora glabripennis TaxID=217634 RepID=UPI000873760F|nr:alpha-tubulin N-acetyltransferase isoform X2 [Anoplophora glabripennis]